MSAYYNEYDPFAAAWLRELIKENLIAPGEVDERSIMDVAPEDLRGFIQCHFFAGIGVWSLALRLAGWSDNREIWTGSCPCQPFSGAGKGAGFDDERHLWPAFEWLIRYGKPGSVPCVGEQVASADGLHWLDLVSADMEGQGYALGALDTCAAGFGSPHIRQRLYWLADGVSMSASGGMGDTIGDRLEGRSPEERSRGGDQRLVGPSSMAGGVAYAFDGGREQAGGGIASAGRDGAGGDGSVDRLADAEGINGGAGLCDLPSGGDGEREPGNGGNVRGLADTMSTGRAKRRAGAGCGPASGGGGDGDGMAVHPLAYWRDADWLLCRDPGGARFRPVEPGSFPLVDARTLVNRVGAVRGAGNAINLAQAQGFIEAVMECRP